MARASRGDRDGVVRGSHQVGIGVESRWHQDGIRMASGWHQDGIRRGELDTSGTDHTPSHAPSLIVRYSRLRASSIYSRPFDSRSTRWSVGTTRALTIFLCTGPISHQERIHEFAERRRERLEALRAEKAALEEVREKGTHLRSVTPRGPALEALRRYTKKAFWRSECLHPPSCSVCKLHKIRGIE